MSKKDRIKVEFVGMSADNVTGSMVWIHDSSMNILVEAGLYQSNDLVNDYKINNRKLPFNVKKIDFILLGHVHADHSMLIPRLYAEGCRAKIIVPEGTTGFYKLLGVDSANIVERDSLYLESKIKKSIHRMYSESDIFKSIKNMVEYEMEKKIELSDRLTIRFIPSGHIVNAAQIEIWVKDSTSRVIKILYTSDLGNIQIPKYYASEFKPVSSANIVIGECTYSDASRSVNPSAREKDKYKMKEIIKNNEGIVEIPVFTLDRCPNILTTLYDIFGNDPTFDTDVVVDSPLAVKMLREYAETLNYEDAHKLYDVLNWDNLKLISDAGASKSYMLRTKKAVVLSAAGMLSKGRSRLWLKSIIGDSKNTIMFVGYASENTLAYKIKNRKESKYINIDGVDYKNACRIVDLHSFTSHMQHSDLLNYYSRIKADKICLVHGEKKSKTEFVKKLQELTDKTTSAKVVNVSRNMTITL